jgi:hypothetical protein
MMILPTSAASGATGSKIREDGGSDYLWFLADFIFKIRCPQVSMFDQRSKPNKLYFESLPDGYREELL